jgi:hypothetical protein
MWVLKWNQERRLSNLNGANGKVTYNDEIRVVNNPVPVMMMPTADPRQQQMSGVYMKPMAPNRQQVVTEEISEVI